MSEPLPLQGSSSEKEQTYVLKGNDINPRILLIFFQVRRTMENGCVFYMIFHFFFSYLPICINNAHSIIKIKSQCIKKNRGN